MEKKLLNAVSRSLFAFEWREQLCLIKKHDFSTKMLQKEKFCRLFEKAFHKILFVRKKTTTTRYVLCGNSTDNVGMNQQMVIDTILLSTLKLFLDDVCLKWNFRLQESNSGKNQGVALPRLQSSRQCKCELMKSSWIWYRVGTPTHLKEWVSNFSTLKDKTKFGFTAIEKLQLDSPKLLLPYYYEQILNKKWEIERFLCCKDVFIHFSRIKFRHIWRRYLMNHPICIDKRNFGPKNALAHSLSLTHSTHTYSLSLSLSLSHPNTYLSRKLNSGFWSSSSRPSSREYDRPRIFLTTCVSLRTFDGLWQLRQKQRFLK